MSYSDLPDWERQARAAYAYNLEESRYPCGHDYGQPAQRPQVHDYNALLRLAEAHKAARRRVAELEASKACHTPHP